MTPSRPYVCHAYPGGVRVVSGGAGDTTGRASPTLQCASPTLQCASPTRRSASPTVRLLVVTVAAWVLLAGCRGGAWGSTWVFDGHHVVVDGETERGMLWVAGGEVRLAPGSAVLGPVVVTGGVLVVDGLVAGPLAHLGGDVRLGPWAAVHGRVVSVAPMTRHADALLRTPASRVPGVPGANWHPLVRALVLALATASASAAWAFGRPEALTSMADALVRGPWRSAAAGVAVAIVAAGLAVGLAFGLGAAFAAGAVLAMGGALALTGWAAVGRALTRALGRGPLADLADRPRLLAVIGGFDTGLTVGLLWAVPAVGAGLALLAALAPIGAVARASTSRRGARRR